MTRLKPLLTWRSEICDSDLTPTQRHVALTLSLHMNERGDSAFPGRRRLAEETGLAQRTVTAALNALVEAEYLELVERGGLKGKQRRANEYRTRTPAAGSPVTDQGSVERTGAGDSRVETGTGDRGSPVPVTEDPSTGDTGSPQLFIEPKRREEPSLRSGSSRPRNLHFDAIVEALGHPIPDSQASLAGRLVAEAKQHDLPPSAIVDAARNLVAAWGPEKLTLASLEKHLLRFAMSPLRDMTREQVDQFRKRLAEDHEREEQLARMRALEAS